MHLWGFSWMLCNLSVSESLLFLRRALAFSAYTCFLDPMSLGRLWEYGGSGTFAAGGTETGLGCFCGCMATCFSTAICWCCSLSLKLSIWLLIKACPCLSLLPVSRVLKECSISSNSGDIDHDVLAELLVSGLEVFEDSCELLADDGCLSWRTISATGTGALCTWATRWEAGQRHRRLTSGSLRYRVWTGRLRVTGWRLWLSEVWRMPCSYPCLLDWNKQIWVSHIQFEFPPVSSRGVTSGLPSWWYCHSAGHRVVLKPCLLGLSARLDPPVWHCLWN